MTNGFVNLRKVKSTKENKSEIYLTYMILKIFLINRIFFLNLIFKRINKLINNYNYLYNLNINNRFCYKMISILHKKSMMTFLKKYW